MFRVSGALTCLSREAGEPSGGAGRTTRPTLGPQKVSRALRPGVRHVRDSRMRLGLAGGESLVEGSQRPRCHVDSKVGFTFTALVVVKPDGSPNLRMAL